MSSLAVAAVSRDTMLSFSPPAATPVTVSVTATLLLGTGGSHGRGIDAGGARARARVQGICCVQGVFPPRWHAGGELRKRLLHAVGPPNRPKLANPSPGWCSRGRATTCVQRPQRRQGDMRTVLGRGVRVHQAGRAAMAVGAGGSSSSSSGASTVAMSFVQPVERCPSPIVKRSSQRKTGGPATAAGSSPASAAPWSVPEHRSCVMEPSPRPAGSGRSTCSGSRRGSAAPLTSALRRWPRSAPGGGGAGGAGRRASELLWEGRARRSGHAWGGAARLEPPLQRRVGARKVCSLGRKSQIHEEPIRSHDGGGPGGVGCGGNAGWANRARWAAAVTRLGWCAFDHHRLG